MSATYRYDIGQGLKAELAARRPLLLGKLGGRMVTRWAGVANPRAIMLTFAIKLPDQIVEAVQLVGCLSAIIADVRSVLVDLYAARRLLAKVTLGLGIVSRREYEVLPQNAEERAFMLAIWEEPGDLSQWLVYCDWLEDQCDARKYLRSRVIRGWNGKKALKVKYGVPEIALGVLHE